jgi:hypothetical protein
MVHCLREVGSRSGSAAVLRRRHPCVSGPLCDVCTDGSLKICRLAAHRLHMAAVVQLIALCTPHFQTGTGEGAWSRCPQANVSCGGA